MNKMSSYTELYAIHGSLRRATEAYNDIHGTSICHVTFSKRLRAENIEDLSDYIQDNQKLAKQNQKQRDVTRIERKSWREVSRVVNALEELDTKLIELVKKHRTKFRTPKDKRESEKYGVIQLSDVHFNECVDFEFNSYNWDIASSRIRKHIVDSMKYFEKQNVGKVVIAMTGDMLNSDRRLDEVLLNADNRANALFLACEILTQAIEEVHYNGYEVSVTFVTGNESRIGEHVHATEMLANDNFDTMLFHLLRHSCDDDIKFYTPKNSLESVIQIGEVNFLMIHGHMGMTRDITSSVSKYMAKYADIGIKVDFVIFGHIHQALVSDLFGRSGSSVGANEYSSNRLNVIGKPSQNCYIVEGKNITGIVNPLDVTDKTYKGYDIKKQLKSYNTKSAKKLHDKHTILTITV